MVNQEKVGLCFLSVGGCGVVRVRRGRKGRRGWQDGRTRLLSLGGLSWCPPASEFTTSPNQILSNLASATPVGTAEAAPLSEGARVRAPAPPGGVTVTMLAPRHHAAVDILGQTENLFLACDGYQGTPQQVHTAASSPSPRTRTSHASTQRSPTSFESPTLPNRQQYR